MKANDNFTGWTIMMRHRASVYPTANLTNEIVKPTDESSIFVLFCRKRINCTIFNFLLMFRIQFNRNKWVNENNLAIFGYLLKSTSTRIIFDIFSKFCGILHSKAGGFFLPAFNLLFIETHLFIFFFNSSF